MDDLRGSLRGLLPLYTASVYRLFEEYRTLGVLSVDAAKLVARELEVRLERAAEDLRARADGFASGLDDGLYDTSRPEWPSRSGSASSPSASSAASGDLFSRVLSPAEELLVASGVSPDRIVRLRFELSVSRDGVDSLERDEVHSLVADLSTWFALEEVEVQLDRLSLDVLSPSATVEFVLSEESWMQVRLRDLPSRGQRVSSVGEYMFSFERV